MWYEFFSEDIISQICMIFENIIWFFRLIWISTFRLINLLNILHYIDSRPTIFLDLSQTLMSILLALSMLYLIFIRLIDWTYQSLFAKSTLVLSGCCVIHKNEYIMQSKRYCVVNNVDLFCILLSRCYHMRIEVFT